MWLADRWKDYELIDCGDGERLERWGNHLLIRPDPQAIWRKASDHPGWRAFNARHHRSASGGGNWEIRNLPKEWEIGYDALRFAVRPMNFKHTGIFPEQAVNWEFLRGQIARQARKLNVLNLFAYTGSASVVLAAAGAVVCHVDAAKNMVQWAKKNAALSGLSEAPVRYLVDDCKKFIEREIRRGNRYDGIIMDPPSYGRGPSGELWKLEDDIYAFIALAAQLLSDDAVFFVLNTYATAVTPEALSYVVSDIVEKPRGGTVESRELGLPVTESGLALPSGAATRWTCKG